MIINGATKKCKQKEYLSFLLMKADEKLDEVSG
jgi:hypothetical protein